MKRKIKVRTIDELRDTVDRLIETGDNQVELVVNPVLLIEREAHDILERAVTDHPKSQGEAPEEIVTECAVRKFRDMIYRLEPESGGGFRVFVRQGCDWVQPWDFAMQTEEDAVLHAEAAISNMIGDLSHD